MDGPPRPPDVALARNGTAVRICGVTYSFRLFRALAARLGEGTVVDVTEDADGRVRLYHHRPGAADTR